MLPETAMRNLVLTRMKDVEERGREAFDQVMGAYPDVEGATLDILQVRAVDALLDAGETASLIVVGKHGGSVLAAKLMGSVTHGVLGSAPVVAVVPKY